MSRQRKPNRKQAQARAKKQAQATRKKKWNGERGAIVWPRGAGGCVPFTDCEGSALDKFARSEISLSAVMLQVYIERHANFDTGISHRLAVTDIAAALRFSARTIYRLRNELRDAGLLRFETGTTATRYHCFPFAREARILENRSWMPAKEGPLELLREGRIGANEVLVYLHSIRNHHLTAGLQDRGVRAVAKLTGLCKSVVWMAWQKLMAVGLVVRERVKRCRFGWLSRYRLWPFKPSIKETHLETLREAWAAEEAAANPPAEEDVSPAPSARAPTETAPTAPEDTPCKRREAGVVRSERVTVVHEGETFAFFPAEGAYARIDAAGAVHPVAKVSAAVFRLFAQVLGLSPAVEGGVA